MPNTEIIEITEENSDLLNMLYSKSAYTITGAGGDLQEWVSGINEILRDNDIGEATMFYTFKGKLMNERYNLKGNVKYQDDITFLAFIYTVKDIAKLAAFKLKMGDRWFDDIVDNNFAHNQVLLN